MKLIKGSAQALAWGKKMQAIRRAGLRTEKQFFGRKGVFAKAGHTTHLNNSQSELWKLAIGTAKRPKVMNRSIGTLFQIIQKEARAWRVLWRTSVSNELLSLGTYKTLGEAIQEADYQALEYRSMGYKNPGEAWHEGMEHVAARYSRSAREPLERAMFKGIEVAHRDSAKAARRLHMNASKERVIRPRHRKNPLAVFGVGNPPTRISTGIAGVIYSRCLEIRAEKTKFKPGLYKHPFSRKAGVQILALDTGDLLVHSTRGVNLWEPV